MIKKNILCMTPVEPFMEIRDCEQYGNIFYEPHISSPEDLKKILIDNKIQYIFTNPNKQGFMLDKESLEGSNLELINTCSTGTNHIDKVYCKKKGIKIWSLAKDFNIIKQLPATSELAFGLMLSLLRHIPNASSSVRDGKWDYSKFIGHQVKGMSIGIVGYGRLGKIMANFCSSFGANVFFYDPYIDDELPHKRMSKLSDLVSHCRVISLHPHVTDSSVGIINKKILDKMQNNSYVINTARGEIVDESAIIDALDNGTIAGYATDVISDEFSDIRKSPIIKGMNRGLNILVTPHIGGMSLEGPRLTYKWAFDKFRSIR